LRRYSKEELIKAVNIVDLAERFAIGLDPINSGNFTHRCKCPSKEHKGGTERTGSLYIDSDNNNFYCFGCSASNNAIDFYMLCKDVDFSAALQALSDIVDPAKIGKVSTKKRSVNMLQLFEISTSFREIQKAHPEDLEWIEGFMKKTDQFLENIDRYDVSRAKDLLKKVKFVIRRRYSKK